MRVVLSQTEKEMNVNNTKITAPINQLIFSLCECLPTDLFVHLFHSSYHIHIES